MDETVEIRFLSHGRAAGIVTTSGRKIKWTAIEGASKEWFIVLHDEAAGLDASLLRLVIGTIERNLLRQAA